MAPKAGFVFDHRAQPARIFIHLQPVSGRPAPVGSFAQKDMTHITALQDKLQV